MSALVMNTYPTTPQQLFLEQKMRDDNNPGCIAYRESEEVRRRKKMLSSKQQKEQEEATKKWEADQIAGYASKRIDFPEYHWWMIQDGKKYFRSSKNFNVYDYSQSSVIVGTWNEETQRIEFVNDLMTRVRELEEIVAKLTATIV
jgi:hypothetical protein